MLIFKHSDWFKNLNSQSECLKMSVVLKKIYRIGSRSHPIKKILHVDLRCVGLEHSGWLKKNLRIKSNLSLVKRMLMLVSCLTVALLICDFLLKG